MNVVYVHNLSMFISIPHLLFFLQNTVTFPSQGMWFYFFFVRYLHYDRNALTRSMRGMLETVVSLGEIRTTNLFKALRPI